MRQRAGSTGPSLGAAEQFGHDVLVRPRSGTSGGDPLVMRCERCFDLRLFQGLRGGAPFHRAQPPKLRERDNGGSLATEVDRRPPESEGRARLPGDGARTTVRSE